jgi:alpha-glucosidase (family GH31 glycosyl hydrolase)
MADRTESQEIATVKKEEKKKEREKHQKSTNTENTNRTMRRFNSMAREQVHGARCAVRSVAQASLDRRFWSW